MFPITCGQLVHIACAHIAHRLCLSYAKLPMSMCPSCANVNVPIVCKSFPSQGVPRQQKLPCQGTLADQVVYVSLPLVFKIYFVKGHRVATLPIAWCLGWLSHGYPVCHVSHLMEPSWAYVAHRKVPSCAYVPHVKVSSFAYVPHVKVPSYAFIVHRVCSLLCPKLSIAWGAPHMPLCAYGSHRKVRSCAKFSIARCHRVPRMPIARSHCVEGFPFRANACQVAHRKVPLCAMLPIARCHCLPTLPIARCHCVAYCLSQGAILHKIYYVKVPSFGDVSHCVMPLEVIAWFPRVPSFPSHGAILCLCSPCRGAIVCLCSPRQCAIMCLCRPPRVPLVVPKVVHHMRCHPCAKEGYHMIPACTKLPI